MKVIRLDGQEQGDVHGVFDRQSGMKYSSNRLCQDLCYIRAAGHEIDRASQCLALLA
jgi:hypothetical protein